MKVELDNIAETMLIALYCRARESEKSNGMINDEKAIEMVSKIDYNFSNFENSKMSQLGVACRTKILDEQTKKFIKENPDGVCVSIGCGLDTRFSRVNNGKIKWYDLDLPEVINIREKFFENSDQQKMISESIFDSKWVNEINHKGKNVLFIFEGILMYFDEKEVKEIIKIIEENFENALILMELSSKFMIRFGSRHELVKKTNATFKWGVKKSKDVEKLSNNIRLINEWYLFDIYKNQETTSKKNKIALSVILPIFNQINNKIALYKI
ncbi:MAG: class I SAM-dependent methyltransferase [Methanobacteriaceae archaeon]|nr:class I SAM-dependent methyltransferase [Methanobacteriaceae archaeon]